jgi:Cu/Ag efflux pump CusA
MKMRHVTKIISLWTRSSRVHQTLSYSATTFEMDMDELLTYIVSHCEKISLLYEEIGTSEKARRENTQSLFDSFVHLMNQQTKTITEERESLKRKCHDALSNIARYKRLMGTYVDENILETPKQPLLTWLSELCDKEEIYQRVSAR